MATSKIFKKVPLTMPGRSGFNMSHNNFFSAPVGTLVPSMIDFLIPGDEVDLSSKLHIQLPPMATDFYGRIQAKEEAFFVPARILFGGWKDFYVNPVDGTTNPSNIDGQLAKYLIGAQFTIDSSGTPTTQTFTADVPQGLSSSVTTALNGYIVAAKEAIENRNSDFFFTPNDDVPLPPTRVDYGAGSLLDYLGFKVSQFASASFDFAQMSDYINLLSDRMGSISVELSTFLSSISQGQILTKFATLNNLGVSFSDSQPLIYPFIFFEAQITGPESNYSHPVSLSVTIFQSATSGTSRSIRIPNILPLMAYHKVFDDWYRAPMIQQSLFKRNVANQSTATSVANMPWITSGAQDKIYFQDYQLNFANGHSLFDLHQRNWQKDYFTSATPEPQAGEASSVKFDIVDDSGEFTIASLRAANALQQWLDRNNIGGFRYGDMIYAQYGVYPSDAITDRAIYLGSTSVDVYNKSIYQQSGDGGTDTNNPFNAIGSKYSNPTGVGDGNFCNNYRVTEAGFIIKLFSLVPQAYYSTGVRRMFMYNDISDIAFPVLAGVGDQEIKGYELTDAYSDRGDDTTFGFIQRYAEYKFIDDQVHGLLRDGQNLESFALQRSFNEVPELSSAFLEIPRDYLDQVSATSYKLSQYGCWVNCYNDYRKSSTLPAYSIPTLEDMKGRTELVDKGGSYLA